MKIKALKAAFPYTIPVLTGYLFIGMAYGIYLNSVGYHLGWAVLMSLIVYAGSMQFVAVQLLTSSFNIINVIFMTLMINARHLFYGLSMLGKFKNLGKKKPYMIFSLTDETFSLLCGVEVPDKVDKGWFYLWVAMLNHIYWIIGSAIGSMIGSVISFNTKGIDFVMTALFVVIFINQWEENKNHMPALIGVGSSVICLVIFGPSNFILPSMIMILIILTIFKNLVTGRNTV